MTIDIVRLNALEDAFHHAQVGLHERYALLVAVGLEKSLRESIGDRVHRVVGGEHAREYLVRIARVQVLETLVEAHAQTLLTARAHDRSLEHVGQEQSRQ